MAAGRPRQQNQQTDRLDRVHDADEALRIAKQAGRNRVVRCSLAESTLQAGERIALHAGKLSRGAVAGNLMSLNLASLELATTVGEAARFLLNRGLTSAPVVDEEGRLVGIVSEKDVLVVMLPHGAWSLPISRISQADVVSYDEQTPVERIFDFLSRVAIRRVIIVRDGRPVGSISRTSLLRWFSNWALSDECPAASQTQTSRNQASAKARQAIERLAARAQRLADNFSAWEAAGSLQDDELYGPMINDVGVMQDLLKDIITLFSIDPHGLASCGIGGIEGVDALQAASAQA